VGVALSTRTSGGIEGGKEGGVWRRARRTDDFNDS